MTYSTTLVDDACAQFLHLCLCGRWDPAALDRARGLADQGEFDWPALLRLAEREKIAPLVCHLMRDRSVLPPPIETDLHRLYSRYARRNTILLAELGGLLRRLTGAGVEVVVLKGAALAETVYESIALRPIGDLDLLVRQEDVPAALDALAAAGYHRAEAETHRGASFDYENEVLLCRRGVALLPVELHWNLLNSPYYQRRIDAGWLWQTARPASIADAPARILGPEALLLHLCSHLALHHGGQGLLWLHDVAEVLVFYRDLIDWQVVLTQAQVYDLVLPLQQVLLQVARQWQAPIPAWVVQRLAEMRPSPQEARVNAWLAAGHRPVAQRFWIDLASTSGARQRLRYAATNLFPSPAYMRQRYGIHHPLQVALSYPYRWFLGLGSVLGPGSKRPKERDRHGTPA